MVSRLLIPVESIFCPGRKLLEIVQVGQGFISRAWALVLEVVGRSAEVNAADGDATTIGAALAAGCLTPRYA